jgi:hypothetical protein
MGLFQRRKPSPEVPTAVQARGDYVVDEHQLSPEEVAGRYGVEVDWKNIGASKGLTSLQVVTSRGLLLDTSSCCICCCCNSCW